MLVRDHQLHTAKPSLLEGAQEALPEDLVFGVADVATQDLPVTVGGDPGRHDHGHRGDLRGLVADMEIGRVEIHVGELHMIERSGAEGADDFVQAATDP